MSATRVRSVSGNNNPVYQQLAIDDSQTINIGDLIQIDATSKKGEAAVAASTTIVGIAQQSITTTTATAADVISILLVRDEVIRIAVSQAGSKKTFATTDKYLTLYDLLDKVSIAPDDTTGGMCSIQSYDNTAHTADVIFAHAALAYIG